MGDNVEDWANFLQAVHTGEGAQQDAAPSTGTTTPSATTPSTTTPSTAATPSTPRTDSPAAGLPVRTQGASSPAPRTTTPTPSATTTTTNAAAAAARAAVHGMNPMMRQAQQYPQQPIYVRASNGQVYMMNAGRPVQPGLLPQASMLSALGAVQPVRPPMTQQQVGAATGAATAPPTTIVAAGGATAPTTATHVPVAGGQPQMQAQVQPQQQIKNPVLTQKERIQNYLAPWRDLPPDKFKQFEELVTNYANKKVSEQDFIKQKAEIQKYSPTQMKKMNDQIAAQQRAAVAGTPAGTTAAGGTAPGTPAQSAVAAQQAAQMPGRSPYPVAGTAQQAQGLRPAGVPQQGAGGAVAATQYKPFSFSEEDKRLLKEVSTCPPEHREALIQRHPQLPQLLKACVTLRQQGAAAGQGVAIQQGATSAVQPINPAAATAGTAPMMTSATPSGAAAAVAAAASAAASQKKKPAEVKQPVKPKPKTKTGNGEKGDKEEKGQDISQLNDLTRVAGVDLEEEERMLEGGSTEYTRPSSYDVDNVHYTSASDLFLYRDNLRKKVLSRIAKVKGLQSDRVGDDVLDFLSLACQEHLRNVIGDLIKISKHRNEVAKENYYYDTTDETNEAMEQIRENEKKVRQMLAALAKRKRDLEQLQQEEEAKKAEAESEEGGKRRKKGQEKIELSKEAEEERRTSQANLAALAAIGNLGRRKKAAKQQQQQPTQPSTPAGANRFPAQPLGSAPAGAGGVPRQPIMAPSTPFTPMSARGATMLSPTAGGGGGGPTVFSPQPATPGMAGYPYGTSPTTPVSAGATAAAAAGMMTPAGAAAAAAATTRDGQKLRVTIRDCLFYLEKEQQMRKSLIIVKVYQRLRD